MTLNNFKKKLVYWGAGDQCLVMRSIVEALGSSIDILIDDTPGLESPLKHTPLLKGGGDFESWLSNENPEDLGFFIAIANPYGFVRTRLHTYLKKLGLSPVTICDPSAQIDSYAQIGEGCQIMRNTVVNAYTILGEQVILNTSSIVEHHCTLGEGVELAPGANLCGRVHIEPYSLIGANATILPRLRIGYDAVVGAGSTVCKNVENEAIVIGSPAKFLKKNQLTNRNVDIHK